jgi:DNA polymerase-3 subunit beta
VNRHADRDRRTIPRTHTPYYEDWCNYTTSVLKITCQTEHLADRLAQAARATSTRASIQVASGVRITAGSGEEPCELAATDLELSLRVPLDAEVEEPGVVVVPARVAQEIVRMLRTDRVTLASDPAGGRIRITSGSGEYSLHTHPVEDFPRLPEIDPERLFDIDRDGFTSTVDRVIRAASRDESRPVLTGVLLQVEPGRVTAAATDSYRLAVKESVVEVQVPEALEAIVPARALQELARLSAGSTGAIACNFDRNQVAFGVDGTWLTARRIEGQFPNFRSLRPEGFEHEVRLPRDELAEIVKRVGVFARNNAPLRFSFSPGELAVSAQTPDVGEARETMPVSFGGELFEIGFNPEFVRDGIDAAASDDVVLRLINPLRPALLSGPEDDFWYLIMPIRLT